MARRSDHSREEIREMALEAAERIIDEQGYAALTARKVAAGIGYTVGTLYLVFQNLDDLVLQVNGRTLDALHARLTTAAEDCGDGAACVLALGHAYLAFAHANRNRWGTLFEHNLPPGREVPDGYRAKVAANFELVEAQLRQAAPHRFPDEIQEAARALWSGVHGVCILGLTERLGILGSGTLETLVESLVGNYLRGFCGG
ncbi:MAG: TetR/AcrR family transcriptional regulator [Chromatiaceae bacterium]|jgi:AcrR family transcriptional regulator|nr:TetR/AcrR family transcriptional regulator [Chromatiaceae bacterium]